MNRDDLLPGQLEVVNSRAQVTLVIGAPGTGKTTVAAWLAREAIERGELTAGQRALFLTFSRSATRRARARATKILGPLQDRLDMATFHSFGYRLLRQFGRYDGHGQTPLPLHTEARRAAILDLPPGLYYDDLVPGLVSLLRSTRLHSLICGRWPLVICDEFQDTHDDEWNVLVALAEQSRLVLFVDPDQMIYDYDTGVSAHRIEQARERADDAVITLDRASLRDPTMIIPDAARAIRFQHYDDPAVTAALVSGRLRVVPRVAPDGLADTVVAEVEHLRSRGRPDVAVMRATNAEVGQLSRELHDRSLDHEICGLPEAHVEALAAMTELCCYAVDPSDVGRCRRAFAVYMAAATRSGRKKLPALVVSMASGEPLTAQPVLETALARLEAALRDAAEAGSPALLDLAAESFEGLPLEVNPRPWRLAAEEFRRATGLVRRDPVQRLPEQLEGIINRRREIHIDADPSTGTGIQLMVLHQSKGREVDAVIIVVGKEYAWSATARASVARQRRVLYVAMTRARHEVIVILAPQPVAFIRPLLTAAKAAGVAT